VTENQTERKTKSNSGNMKISFKKKTMSLFSTAHALATTDDK